MSNWINLPEDTTQYIGFVYLIRCNHPDVVEHNQLYKEGKIDTAKKQFYIGKKQLLKRVKRKPLKGKTRNRITFKDNDVDKYWGSSKELLNDIEKYGIEHFSREVIEMCYSKFQMSYGELLWQIKSNALMDGRFHNGILNARISRSPKGFIDIERDVSTLKL